MRRITVMLAAVCVIAGACSTDTEAADTATTTTTEGGGQTAAESSTTSTAESSSTTTAQQQNETTTTTAPAPASLDTCVVGTWVLDPVAFFETVLAEQPQEGMDGEFVFVDGEYLLIIGADGTFESRRDNWSFAVTSEFGDLEVTVKDSDVGTWTLDGDVLSTTLEPGDPAEIAITIDGQPFVFPGDITPFEPPEAEFTGATVACDGQSLSATADGFTSVWTKSG